MSGKMGAAIVLCVLVLGILLVAYACGGTSSRRIPSTSPAPSVPSDSAGTPAPPEGTESGDGSESASGESQSESEQPQEQDESPSLQEQLGLPEDEPITEIKLWTGEEYPPPPEIGDVMYQVRYNDEKMVEKDDFLFLPELNMGEEDVESFDIEVTDPWKTFQGKDIVRVAVKAVNAQDLGTVRFYLFGEPWRYIPLWAEPGDPEVFPLEDYHTFVEAGDTVAGDGAMGIAVGNYSYLVARPFKFDDKPGGGFYYESGAGKGFYGSGAVAYAYFLKADYFWDYLNTYTRYTSIEGMRDHANVPAVAFVLSDVYAPEMFGGRDNEGLCFYYELLDNGTLESSFGGIFLENKSASTTEEGDYLWEEVTPQEKAQNYPAGQCVPLNAIQTAHFTLWPINADWTADTASLTYYAASESCSAYPDENGYYDATLEISAVDAPEWTGSWVTVNYPAEFIFDYQEIGDFFVEEADRIGAALTGIYEFMEAGVVRVHYDVNGGGSGSGWIETLHFKWLGEGLGGGNAGGNSGGPGGSVGPSGGGKSASIYQVVRRFADQFAIYNHESATFSGTTLDDYFVTIRQKWYDFREENGGDYNNDTYFNIHDITPIARYYGQHLQVPNDFESPVTYVDGNLSNVIDIGDVTPLSWYFGFETWGIYVELYQVLGDRLYEPGSTRTRPRQEPYIYFTSPHPWVHPRWHVQMAENAAYIGRHYLCELTDGYWDYAHRYLNRWSKSGKYVVSNDQQGWSFRWTVIVH